MERFRVYQAVGQDSGLQVTFLSLSVEGFEFIPAKRSPSFLTASSPVFSLSGVMPGGGPELRQVEGPVSQHHRRLAGLYFGGVTWATTLSGAHNGLRVVSLSPEAHGSAEKGTQCAATRTPGDGLVWRQESVIIHGSTRS